MRDARITTIVTTSGERFAVSEERHPSRSYGRMFHTVFDDAVEKLAAQVTSGIAMRLFMILPKHLSYTVFKRLDQVTIGAKLNVDQTSISRAMKQLLDAGAVEKRGSGPVTEWRLTPDYGWRGDVDSYHQAQRARGKAAPKPTHAVSKAAECIDREAAPTVAAKENGKQTRLRLLTTVKPANRPAPKVSA